jgi:hypothetical protein
MLQRRLPMFGTRIANVAAVLAVMLNASRGYSIEHPLSLPEVCRMYAMARKGWSLQHVESVETTKVVDSVIVQPTWSFERDSYISDGNRIDVNTNLWTNLPSATATTQPTSAIQRHMIWNETWYDFYGGGEPVLTISGNNGDSRRFNAVAYRGATLNGIIPGDLDPLDVVLGSASASQIADDANAVKGVSCLHVSARTPGGKYNIWFDPERGFNIVRAQIIREGDDIAFGKKMSAPLAPLPANVRFPAKKKGNRLSRFEFSLDSQTLRHIGNIWVPVEAVYHNNYFYEDETSLSEEHVHRRLAIDLQPNFTDLRAFEPNFPENTLVLSRDTPQIKRIWKGGKPVAIVDAHAVNTIDRAVAELPQPAPGESNRGWLRISAAVIVLVGIFGCIELVRRARNAKRT